MPKISLRPSRILAATLVLAHGAAIAMVALAGMPLFAGFVTKFYLFIAVAQNGALWLGLVGIAVVIGTLVVSMYLPIFQLSQAVKG